MIYIKSGRTCCGDKSDLCLAYASIRIPDEYELFINQFKGTNGISKHKLQRAFDSCIAVPGDKTTSCYINLLDCISNHVDPLRHLHTL